MSKKSKLLDAVQEKVFEIFKRAEEKQLVYHNYNHTVEVVNAANEIGIESGLKKAERKLLLIAAWFHDTGYVEKYKGHEAVSATYAAEFLAEQNFDKEEIDMVTSLIMSTTFQHVPANLMEEVLCDADFSHLGKKDYFEKTRLLRLEWELTGQTPEGDNWPNSEISFLSLHKFRTEYGQRAFASRKGKNLLNLKDLQLQIEKVKDKKQQESKKNQTPQRGIETMFRVSFRNHMNLSAIADNKANIMLSVNAIIISIALTTVIPSFYNNSQLILPTIVLLLVCTLTIIFATLSTRPKISEGKFTREDVKQRKPNLLFFGNFHGVPFPEFEWGMEEMMKNRDFLYGSMVKDFYSLGTVLAKKYKYLRICYNIFMYGLVLAILAFIIAFLVPDFN